VRLFSSLTNRIFLASALLAVLVIGIAIYVVNVRVTTEAEGELRRGLEEAGTLVDEQRATLFENSSRLADLIADLPKLEAAAATDDPPTVQPIAQDYQQRVKSDLFLVAGRSGRVLAEIGTSVPPDAVVRLSAGRDGLTGRLTAAFWPHPKGIMQVVTVPISVGAGSPEVLGTLSLGFLFDDRLAARFKARTESEIAFALDGQIRAATLPASDYRDLTPLLGKRGIAQVSVGGDEYLAVLRPLVAPGVNPRLSASPADAGTGGAGPVAIILRSRTERLRFLRAIHTALAGTAVVAVLLATLLSYGVARTITRPLDTITAGMREMAATGDLTRKITLGASRWQDEDARLLATTFNILTDSIARFQREVAERERLSSLGRMSTVVAHEVRNPLMIIKASLRPLKRAAATSDTVREAVDDIDEEVDRLNRVVNEVLDFARPIRFDLAPADLNRLCQESAAAAIADGSGPGVRLMLDPGLPQVTMDAERVRAALVNILVNARQAVVARRRSEQGDAPRPDADGRGAGPAGQAAEGGGAEDVELVTERVDAERVAIIVRDRGIGVEPAMLHRVFEPYFTTKRAGTGLGLAIARNVIEGLGGRITVDSRVQAGTEVRIELPVHAARDVARTGQE